MQNYATTAPIAAIVEIPAGRVELHAADRADTTVQVRPADASKTRDVKMAQQTTVDYTDGVLRIRTPNAKNQIFGPTGSLHIVVHLPTGSRVEATTGAAELHTSGRLGDLSFDGAYRDITTGQRLEALTATVWARRGVTPVAG